jgi:hypothetical protein
MKWISSGNRTPGGDLFGSSCSVDEIEMQKIFRVELRDGVGQKFVEVAGAPLTA